MEEIIKKNSEESEKYIVYYFRVNDNVYGGYSLSYDTKYYDESFEIELEIPEKGFYLYIINEFSCWQIEKRFFLDDYKNAKKTVLKIYSQIHNHLPFSETERKYPKISKEIRNMKNIDFERDGMDQIYFVVIINNKGNIMYKQVI